MMKKIIVVLMFILMSSFVVADYNTDFKDGDTIYKGVLQSNDVKDVFAYDTSEDNIVSPLWKHGGNIGKCAMSFDGSGDYVSVSSALVSGTSFSLEAWVKLTGDYNNWNSIISQGTTSSPIYFHINENNKVEFQVDGSAFGEVESNSVIKLNEWYHVVAVSDAGTQKLYVNGVLQTDTSSISPDYTPTHTNLKIGSNNNNGLIWDGHIDEVRIYNDALTSTEISDSYERGLQGLKSNITDNLVGAWGFDECSGSSATDESGNGNTGTITGATHSAKSSWYKEGNMNEKGAYFDGDGDYISLDSDTGLSPTSKITVAAWIKADSQTGGNRYIYDRLGSTEGYGLFIDSSGYPVFSINGGFAKATSTVTIQPNEWYFIVGTYDQTIGGTEELKVYINGVKRGSDDYSTLIGYDVETRNQIGRAATSNYFDGALDNIRVFDDALSSSEIKDIYTRELAGADTSTYDNDASLVGFWDFENSSDWYADKSGEGNDGTAIGNTSVSMVDYLQDDGAAASVYDQAAVFDGNGDYITIAEPSVGTDPFSISVWVKQDSMQNSAGVIRSTTGDSVGDFLIDLPSNGRVRISNWRTSGAPNNSSISTEGTIKVGTWHHVVGGWDGSDRFLYVDGVKQSTTTVSTGGGWGTGHEIGRSYPGAQWEHNGAIDELKIFNKALSQLEIDSIYESGLNHTKDTITDQLVSYWSFDGDYKDDSGNGNDGTTNGDVYLYGRTGSKEFPEKAYLVATDEGLDVIDAMDDSLWMRYAGYNGQIVRDDVTSVNSLGSNVYVTHNTPGVNGGLSIIKYNEDLAKLYYADNNLYTYETISQRNDGNIWQIVGSQNDIISRYANDVSVAEIDGHTYVAVATDGGVSIINESGNSVIDINRPSGGTTFENIYLTADGEVYIHERKSSGPQGIIHSFYVIPPENTTIYGAYRNTAYCSGSECTASTPKLIGQSSNLYNDLYVTSGTSTANLGDNTIYVATDAGVSVIDEYQGSESSGTARHYIGGGD